MIYFLLIKSIIKSKCMVLYKLCNSIDFILGFVYFYLWVGTGNGVNLSVLLLFLENGSLAYTNCQLYLQNIKTLSLTLDLCGHRSFYLYLFFSIIISKSISTFLPLAKLRAFFSYLSSLSYYIFLRLYYLFIYIFFIYSKGLGFAPCFIFGILLIILIFIHFIITSIIIFNIDIDIDNLSDLDAENYIFVLDLLFINNCASYFGVKLKKIPQSISGVES